MENKRTKGIAVLAWSILIGSVLSLVTYKASLELNPPISNFIYAPILFASIIASIYLLKLRKEARIAIIIISVIVALETILSIPYCINKYNKFIEEKFDGYYKIASAQFVQTSPKPTLAEEASLKQIEANEANIKNIMLVAAIIILSLLFFMSLAFNLVVIYYFTRPKVKAEFK